MTAGLCLPTFAQTTAFTYQGQLAENDAPYSGSAEFQFTLWDAVSGGAAVATNNPPELIAPVSNGLFTVELDFGDGAFDGAERFLQVDVRTMIGPFIALSPRQPVTPAPQAIHANTADTALEATTVNMGTIINPTFIGTTGTDTPLEFFVNNQRALRIEDNGDGAEDADTEPDGAPNVIGGATVNFVADGVVGATISGGGAMNHGGIVQSNSVLADFGSVLGGLGNTASGFASTALGNYTTASGYRSTAMGFLTTAGGSYSTAMGYAATASSLYCIAMGDSTEASGIGSTALGHQTSGSGRYSTAMGSGTTASGQGSTAMGTDTTASGDYSTAMGGFTTAAGDSSFAAGFSANANHDRAFVWSGAGTSGFSSIQPYEFAINAPNGVRIANSGDGAVLLRFDTEREWQFRQVSSGAGTALELGTVATTNPKNFIIRANAVGINTTAPTHLLHVNGVARSTQSTWATSSDRRAKHRIATIERSLDRIARLRPVSFEYTTEYAAGREGYKGRFTGFIAQEVEPVFPDMVETVHEKIGEREVDDFRLLNAGGLTPHLVAAIQELSGELRVGSQRSEASVLKLEQKLQQKGTEIAELRQRLEHLEQLINATIAGGRQ